MENASFWTDDSNVSPTLPRCNHLCSTQMATCPEGGRTAADEQHLYYGHYWKLLNRSRWTLPYPIQPYDKESMQNQFGNTEKVNSVSYIYSLRAGDPVFEIPYGVNNEDSKSWETSSYLQGWEWKIMGRNLFSGQRWHHVLNWVLIYPFLALSAWAFIYILFGEEEAFVGGSLFSLFLLEVTAITLGELSGMIKLPPALGMLGAGLALTNVPAVAVGRDLSNSVSGPLRAMSVVILLTRGALSVDPSAIWRLRKVVPQLAVISCIIEAAVASTAVHFILQFPIEWSALMGCIMSAMSGAIVVPLLESLNSESHFERKEAITIAKVACGLDAIIAICMAKFALGFIFAKGDLYGGLIKGVVEVLMGGAFGGLWGSLVGFLLNARHGNGIRTFAVFAGGCMSLLGLTKIGYPRGGPLGVFSGSLIVACLWRRKKVDGSNNERLQSSFTKLWFFFQPLLFGIIGARTDFRTVDWSILSKGILCFSISIGARTLVAFAMTSCVTLTWQQRVFIALAWIPKGTVQAALGPVPLDTAVDLNFGSDTEDMGYKIMNLAVLVIILASSLGSVCLLLFGKICLKR